MAGLFAESQKCIARHDLGGAIEVLQRAHKLDPTNDKILVDLGSACAKAYDFAVAQHWFDEAAHISPTPPPGLRWNNYQKYFEPHLPKLAPLLRAFGYE